jgi:hypothetical protein
MEATELKKNKTYFLCFLLNMKKHVSVEAYDFSSIGKYDSTSSIICIMRML